MCIAELLVRVTMFFRGFLLSLVFVRGNDCIEWEDEAIIEAGDFLVSVICMVLRVVFPTSES